MTDWKLHFGYLYSRPSLTAEADYAETSTFGQNHRLSVGASLGLFKTDKWYLSEGAVLGQVDYSFYIGEERNEESHSMEYGVDLGWKQTLLKYGDVLNLHATPMFRLGHAENTLNFGRGFPSPEEESRNGAFALMAGVDICSDYLCATPMGGYGWEKTLKGGPAHKRQGWEGGMAFSFPLFREENRPSASSEIKDGPDLTKPLDEFLRQKSEDQRQKIKADLLTYLNQRISRLRDSELRTAGSSRADYYQEVAKDLRRYIETSFDLFLVGNDQVKVEKFKAELLGYLDEQLNRLRNSDFQRADHFQAVANDVAQQAGLEETAVLAPALMNAIDHAVARDRIFRMPHHTLFMFGSSEISLDGQWLTVGSPHNIKDKRKDIPAFDCFGNPGLDYFREMCTRFAMKLAYKQKSGTIQDKYRFRVVVKGYANDIKSNEHDKAYSRNYNIPHLKSDADYMHSYGAILKKLAYQRAQAVIDYLLHQNEIFHQDPLYPNLGQAHLTEENQARRKELKQKGWNVKMEDVCPYRLERMNSKGELVRRVVPFMAPFNKDNKANDFFEVVNQTPDTDPITEVHKDFADTVGVDVLSPYFRAAAVRLEIYKNDEAQPLKGAALDEFVAKVLLPVEGDDESILVQ
ncbi:MAG TPA: hypothetical protein DDW49_01955 [Deltaproteobacteria bacterium]|nr:hypothetical protein [Deltaproteobacteria bacterium]